MDAHAVKDSFGTREADEGGEVLVPISLPAGSCMCNQPNTAMHLFGDEQFCWASGKAKMPDWVRLPE